MRDNITVGNIAENKFRGKGRGQIKQPLTELRNFALVTQTSEANVGGWGGESNREIVSCRACVRACGSDAR